MDLLIEVANQSKFLYKILFKATFKKLNQTVKIFEIEKKYALKATNANIIMFPDLRVFYMSYEMSNTQPMREYINKLNVKKLYIYDSIFDITNIFNDIVYLYFCDAPANLLKISYNKPKLEHLICTGDLCVPHGDYNIIKTLIDNSFGTLKLKTLVFKSIRISEIEKLINKHIKNMPIQNLSTKMPILGETLEGKEIKYLNAPGLQKVRKDDLIKSHIHTFVINHSAAAHYFNTDWKLTSLTIKNANLTYYNNPLLHRLRVSKFVPELRADVHTLIIDKCDVINNLEPHVLYVGGDTYNIMRNLRDIKIGLKKLVIRENGNRSGKYNLRKHVHKPERLTYGNLDDYLFPDQEHEREIDYEYRRHKTQMGLMDELKFLFPDCQYIDVDKYDGGNFGLFDDDNYNIFYSAIFCFLLLDSSQSG